jgi:hypothetical protein
MIKVTGLSNRQILARLRKTDVVLAGKAKSQPIIVYRHGRWHMLIVSFVTTPDMRTMQGIATVNFMSPYRGGKTILEWLPYSKITPFEEVSPAFRQELAAKVLPTAEDYRPCLQKGLVTVAGGFTTDTLISLNHHKIEADKLVATIDAMMKEGGTGPFLHFERSYHAFQGDGC